MRSTRTMRIGTVILLVGLIFTAAAGMGIEITVLYDNYTLHEQCQADWGFSCMITGTEKSILFDAGTYGNILLGNMDTLQVDAQEADLFVLSHNHGDHTGDWQPGGGLLSFLGRNGNLSAYLPPSVPSGRVHTLESFGVTAQIVNESMQICDRVHLTGPMSGTATEQSLVLDTPKGLVVLTGCAHQGVVAAVSKAKQMLDKEVYFVFGGFHLLDYSDSRIQGIIQQFRELGVQKVGPSHCTGARAIELFRQAYREDFIPVGVGRISIPRYGDFTGDWKVDIDDLLILIEHWGQDEPSLDIAPGLFGDGQVGRADLEILMSHWGQEIVDPTMLAHWKLDETEGDIARDHTAGTDDATVVGDPVWEPEGGQLGGALRLDGIDDCVVTDVVLSPADGPFSILAWIRGGEPGQVIISQVDGVNWLLVDAVEGTLATELVPPVQRNPVPPLVSDSVVTDDIWHRVAFVWDGASRSLYVDETLVASDEQIGLVGSDGGLNIGCDKDMTPTTFFSGLIDDVRIYNRAVRP